MNILLKEGQKDPVIQGQITPLNQNSSLNTELPLEKDKETSSIAQTSLEGLVVELKVKVFEKLPLLDRMKIMEISKGLNIVVKEMALRELKQMFPKTDKTNLTKRTDVLREMKSIDLHIAIEIKKSPSLLPLGGFSSERRPESLEDLQKYIQALKELTKNKESVVNLLNKPSSYQLPSILLNIFKEKYPEEFHNAAVNLLISSTRRGRKFFFELPSSVINDKDIVLAAVTEDGWALQYASPDLKNNRDFILSAVMKNVWALKYASPELQNNRDVVLAAVRQSGDALQYANEDLKNDPAFMKEVDEIKKNRM